MHCQVGAGGTTPSLLGGRPGGRVRIALGSFATLKYWRNIGPAPVLFRLSRFVSSGLQI
jgi:hypothetical protein